MNFKYTFKHMQALESMEDYAAHRIAKIEKYGLHKDLKTHFIFESKKKKHKCEILVDAGSHHYAATAIEDDMYAAIDKAVARMEKQLVKEKERVQEHHARHAQRPDFESLYKDLASVDTFDIVKKAD